MKPHKHAELIKAWADGAEIQCYDTNPREHRWIDCMPQPSWHERVKYRVKPQRELDHVFYTHIRWSEGWQWIDTTSTKQPNLKIIFDGETGEIKSAEVIK